MFGSSQVNTKRGLESGCKGVVKKVSLRSRTVKWVVEGEDGSQECEGVWVGVYGGTWTYG